MPDDNSGGPDSDTDRDRRPRLSPDTPADSQLSDLADNLEKQGYVFEEWSSRNYRLARRCCDDLTRLFELTRRNELWFLQIQGTEAVPVMKGSRERDRYIDPDLIDGGELAAEELAYAENETSYSDDWEDYLGAAEISSPPPLYVDFGYEDFLPDGPLQGAILGPELRPLYEQD